MRMERAGLSRHASAAKAMDYMLKRWGSFARFLDDGRICLTNNAAERALRGIALGRRAWLFAGSDRGGVRAAVMYTLIGTAKLNDVDPQAWLADVLDRIAEKPQTPSARASPLALEGQPATGLGRITFDLWRPANSRQPPRRPAADHQIHGECNPREVRSSPEAYVAAFVARLQDDRRFPADQSGGLPPGVSGVREAMPRTGAVRTRAGGG